MTEFKLETRECACGCKRSWKCLPNSTSRYAMRSHNPRPYMPWTEERARFKAVRKWLDVDCGDERLSGQISESYDTTATE